LPSDELVGRLLTVLANPGTPPSSEPSNVRTVRLRLLPNGSQDTTGPETPRAAKPYVPYDITFIN
jgi:hypothetical protein